jgi:hypothetical protein
MAVAAAKRNRSIFEAATQGISLVKIKCHSIEQSYRDQVFGDESAESEASETRDRRVILMRCITASSS